MISVTNMSSASRFESISVRDHMTNLYAPRLIVEKTVAEKQNQPSVESNGTKVFQDVFLLHQFMGPKSSITYILTLSHGTKVVDAKKDKTERKQFK